MSTVTQEQAKVIIECVCRAELRILIKLLRGLEIFAAQSANLEYIADYEDRLVAKKSQYTTEDLTKSQALFQQTMREIVEIANPIANKI